jgi:hypothetical protein
MTMIDRTPANESQSEIASLNTKIGTLTETLYTQRTKVRDLVTRINDYIAANNCELTDDIPLEYINEVITDAFGTPLTFEHTYEVKVSLYVDATFTIKAESEDDAKEEVTNLWFHDDAPFSLQNDDVEQSDVFIDRVNVQSVTRV